MEQNICDKYAIYNADTVEVMRGLPKESVGVSIYSPPFIGLYVYSSGPEDLSNSRTPEQFFEHYEYVVREIYRLTPPGRITAVHCADVPSGNSGCDHLTDFPGDIIRLHEKIGFHFAYRIHIWKEPLTIRNKLMVKNLFHTTLCEDSTRVGIAGADYLLVFRKRGNNKIPVVHPSGLTEYAGSAQMPSENQRYKNWKGSQLENKYSHWIWQQYASSNWYDVRLSNVLPYLQAKEDEDEKHLHPMALDIYERGIVLWSNFGEVVLEPCMGVGSGVYQAVKMGRKAVGVELKASYFRQAIKNLESLDAVQAKQANLFGLVPPRKARAGKGFIEVNRFFPSSKICSCCMRAQVSMPLNIRSWRCGKCGTLHDRDINAAQNIRLEAQRMIAAGIAGTANEGTVSQGKGRKSSVLARAVEVGSL